MNSFAGDQLSQQDYFASRAHFKIILSIFGLSLFCLFTLTLNNLSTTLLPTSVSSLPALLPPSTRYHLDSQTKGMSDTPRRTISAPVKGDS